MGEGQHQKRLVYARVRHNMEGCGVAINLAQDPGETTAREVKSGG